MSNLTKPQVAMLTQAMRDVVNVSGPKWNTAHALEARGLVEVHENAITITKDGLKELRYYRAVKYANQGSMAQLLDLEEVDKVLAEQVPA